ncbi:DUF2931 family protein [Stutzerimonas marianensis]
MRFEIGYWTKRAPGWRSRHRPTGAAIFVRWQSVVEPQTYRADARQIMHESTHRRCPETPERTARYMATAYLGLAPGGAIQVWVVNSCGYAMRVARGQGEIEPLGHISENQGVLLPPICRVETLRREVRYSLRKLVKIDCRARRMRHRHQAALGFFFRGFRYFVSP